ncbi:MAG TPA: YihY/virulence factor BrkB family protein [Chondromyces sp.]|nr:YihY/virulence factor BrkB family protein [Chondromyces sp.]
MALSKDNLRIFIKHLIRRIKNSDVPGMAAQMAYFFILSLFPLLIFMVTLLPYLPFDQMDILSMVEDYAPAQALEIVETTLNEVMAEGNGGLLSFGIIGTIWSASNGINAIIKGLNHAYDVEETRSFVKARGLSVLLTFALILVVIVALVLQVFGKHIGDWASANLGVPDQLLTIWNWVRWLISPLILFTVFASLYFFAPNLKIEWPTVMPGALFSTIGWIIVSIGFSFYVGNFGNYSATYGSIGGIIILMIWIYLSAMILLIGGEINALRDDMKGKI